MSILLVLSLSSVLRPKDCGIIVVKFRQSQYRCSELPFLLVYTVISSFGVGLLEIRSHVNPGNRSFTV